MQRRPPYRRGDYNESRRYDYHYGRERGRGSERGRERSVGRFREYHQQSRYQYNNRPPSHYHSPSFGRERIIAKSRPKRVSEKNEKIEKKKSPKIKESESKVKKKKNEIVEEKKPEYFQIDYLNHNSSSSDLNNQFEKHQKAINLNILEHIELEKEILKMDMSILEKENEVKCFENDLERISEERDMVDKFE